MTVGGRLRQLGTRRLRAFAPILSTAFSPASIPDLAVWFDANDTASLTVDGSNKVSQWNDKSGNARHATQGAEANQPTLLTNQLNGRPGVRGYDNQWMSFSGPDLSGSGGFTVIAVGEMGSTTSEGVYSQIPGAGSNNGVVLWTGIFRSGRSGGPISVPTGIPSTSPGFPYIWIYRNDGTKTTANTKFLASWNATERVGTIAQDVGTPAAGTAYLLAAGPTDSNSDTNLHEFLIFDRNLSDVEKDTIYTYLYAKWWPAASAPAGISSGLALWLDASDASTLWIDSSNNVGGWLDKSGNNRNVSQTIVLERPSYIAGTDPNAIGGLPVLSSDSATKKWLTRANSNMLSNATGGTLISVFRQVAGSSAQVGMMNCHYTGNTTDRRFTAEISSNRVSVRKVSGAADSTVTTTITNGIPTRMWARLNLTTATFDAKVNSVSTTGTSPAAGTYSSDGDSLQIFTQANQVWRAYTGEIIFYNRPLSDSELTALEAYTTAKWGV
jgi:hypothetical protein